MFTKQQALAITGFTGFNAINFGEFQQDVEIRLGRSVWTHEFANEKFVEQVKELYREDFLKECQ